MTRITLGLAVRFAFAGIIGAVLAVYAVGFSIERFCSAEGNRILPMNSPTCRVIGDYGANDDRLLIDLFSTLVGASGAILFVAMKTRRKNVL